MELPLEIVNLIDNNELDAAIIAITRLLEEHDDDARLHYERGRLYWRLGQHRNAINDYAEAAEADSASPAVEALRQSQAIMAFYDKNRYNP